MLEPDEYEQQLTDLLSDPIPKEVVVVGEVSAARVDAARWPIKEFHDLTQCIDGVSQIQAQSSLLLTITPDRIDTTARLLGRACQLFPQQVLIELQHNTGDKTASQSFRETCFAMGFRHALQGVSDVTEYQLYEFRLKNYKQAPDWLNARFWANPERYNMLD